MIKGIFASGSGMQPRMTRLEVVANNIANINTTGFKKDSMFVQMVKNAGVAQAQGEGELRGLNAKEFTDFSEGSFLQTKNPLDLAIQGRGFFVVETPQGIRYTRNGNCSLKEDGTVVNADGYPLLSSSGPIRIPQTQKNPEAAISVNQLGEITYGNTSLGKIRVADFNDLNQLKKAGQSLFASDGPEKPESADGSQSIVRQGYLEESNVEGIGEMVQLVELTRSFETDQRTIQAQDSTLERAMDIGRL